MTLYLAYGSNMNRQQMQRRCPGAKAVRKIYLKDARLVFRHVLDVEYHPESLVPCVVWEINAAHEHDMDMYEGVASGVYAKEYVTLDDGQEALVYVMLTDGICPPEAGYYEKVKQGYIDFKLDLKPLRAALRYSWHKKEHSETTRRRIRGKKLFGGKKKKEAATLPMAVATRKQDAMARKAANGHKPTNLSDWLAERKAQGKGY